MQYSIDPLVPGSGTLANFHARARRRHREVNRSIPKHLGIKFRPWATASWCERAAAWAKPCVQPIQHSDKEEIVATILMIVIAQTNCSIQLTRPHAPQPRYAWPRLGSKVSGPTLLF
jgi:hypothetical protein